METARVELTEAQLERYERAQRHGQPITLRIMTDLENAHGKNVTISEDDYAKLIRARKNAKGCNLSLLPVKVHSDGSVEQTKEEPKNSPPAGKKSSTAGKKKSPTAGDEYVLSGEGLLAAIAAPVAAKLIEAYGPDVVDYVYKEGKKLIAGKEKKESKPEETRLFKSLSESVRENLKKEQQDGGILYPLGTR